VKKSPKIGEVQPIFSPKLLQIRGKSDPKIWAIPVIFPKLPKVNNRQWAILVTLVRTYIHGGRGAKDPEADQKPNLFCIHTSLTSLYVHSS
jgi:hypothetical protein